MNNPDNADRDVTKDSIVRYNAAERINHWVVAITFVILALSGLALFHPALFWLSFVLGGGPWTRILHPFIGLVMFVCFALLTLRFWRHNLISKNDVAWLENVGDVISNREENLPPVGRYNGGQKLLFWVMIACMAGLLLSGIVIWRAWFSWLFPIFVIRLAVVLHALCGFGLIVGIIVHIYAAIWVQGTVGAMTRGTVSRAWARKHHAEWYRNMTGE
ncbi:Formate dehydrogenase O gamma subunit [Collimonas arenae]|uniref:Formate dehydrogenase O gamma subunit n=1 Tax=Collimonas arenae TaxID=279058 RepID=A0A0A1F6A5_9BURK|nr:formate dehydrogenase subunit gamma [Collimonas arenae]AIY40071.1 Formate dehydrogenase O gamma subunit [Collimonas arenae]